MRRALLCLVSLLVFAPALWALDEPPDKPKPDKPQTPAEQYKALVEEINKARQAYSDAYRQAKTDEERQKVFTDKYPQPEKFAPRFLELAEKHASDAAAVDALAWIATNVRRGSENDKALDILFRDHLKNEKLGPVCGMLVYSPGPNVENLLRKAMEQSPHHAVQGQASYALAQHLMRFRKADEAEKLFEQVVAKYADVKRGQGSLADAAKADLFELRNLAIGKPAPDIEGEDIDGTKFKLSDYRGKVVVLDFWGHW
jgi:hypothetical protein